MTEYLVAHFKQVELNLLERRSNQRREWRSLHTIDSLERALGRARQALRSAPAA